MKKLILSFALALGISATASANKYTLDEQQVDNAFTNSTEITFEQKMSSSLNLSSESFVGKSDTKTRGGYLVRSFFCGAIALHRYYMGTNKKAMWAMYLCIPVVGGINGCVDFWWVVFDKEAMDKYANNDKYIVWLD